jgi:anti-sigma B factor antagonist
MQIVERNIGDIMILDLNGRLILDDGFEPLRESLNRVIGDGWRKVLLNLADVVFLDSAGVGLIACKYITLRRHNGQLKLCQLQERSRKVLLTTKLLTVFETYATEAGALKSFEAGSSQLADGEGLMA